MDSFRWADIAFQLDPLVEAETAEAWRWLIPAPWKSIVCSMFGGLFLETDEGVLWLECPTAEIVRVSDTSTSFNQFMRGTRDDAWWNTIREWFLPEFVYELHAAGKVPGAGQCFGLTILPIFEGGKYDVGNVWVAPIREWLLYTGSMHLQLKDIPDGGKVEIVVTD